MHKTITGNVLTDVTSVVDSGIMLCAGLSAKFKPEWRILVAILPPACWEVLLLGCGTRAAYGCNIGAFFSGVA